MLETTFPYPFRRYVYGSLLRGRPVAQILTCLRTIGMARALSASTIQDLLTPELTKDIAAYASGDAAVKMSLAKKYDLESYLSAVESTSVAMKESWDLITVKYYREYILVLATIPSVTADMIVENFNRKFSREISHDGISLLINVFWDRKGLSTLMLKRAVDDLVSISLSAAVSKLLFGNPLAAAKSVGATLKLHYGLILEEMLADLYTRYKEMSDRKAPIGDVKDAAYAVMKIGDRIDKMNKKSTDNDVLRGLLEELKLETHDTSYTLTDFASNEREIV